MLPTPPVGAPPISQVAYIHQKISNLVSSNSADFRDLYDRCRHPQGQEFRLKVISTILELIDFHDPKFSHPHPLRIELLQKIFNETSVGTWFPSVQQRFESSNLSVSASLTTIPEGFFYSFFQMFNLAPTQQICVITFILSSNQSPRTMLWVKEASLYLYYFLHENNISAIAGCPDAIIYDFTFVILHTPIHFISHRAKRRFFFALKSMFPHATSKFSPSVQELLNYQPYEQPKSIPFTSNIPIPTMNRFTHGMGSERRLVDIVLDVGPLHLDTKEKIHNLLITFSRHCDGGITEHDLAPIFCIIFRTQYFLMSANNYPSMEVVKSHFNPPKMLPGIDHLPTANFSKCWDIGLWVEATNSFNLSWYLIFRLLDQPEMYLPAPECFGTICDVWKFASMSSSTTTMPNMGVPHHQHQHQYQHQHQHHHQHQHQHQHQQHHQHHHQHHQHQQGNKQPARFPTEFFLGVWRNRQGQLSIIKALISLMTPHPASLATHHPPGFINFTTTPTTDVTEPIEDWPYPKQLSQGFIGGASPSAVEIHTQIYNLYYSVESVETLLSLCEAEVELTMDSLPPQHLLKRECIKWPLFQKAIVACPEVLLCSLTVIRRKISERQNHQSSALASGAGTGANSSPGEHAGSGGGGPGSSGGGLDHSYNDPPLNANAIDLCCGLIDVLTMHFLTQGQSTLNAMAASALFKRLWADIPREFIVAMIQLHHRDRSFLMRALEIVHDLKTEAMSSISDLRVDPFRIDFVVLAAKRQYISLETWLKKQIAFDHSYDSLQNPVHFHQSLLDYLRVNAHADNPTLGGTPTAAGGLPHPTGAAAAGQGSRAGNTSLSQQSMANGFVVGDTFVPQRNQYNPLTIDAAAQIFRTLINCYTGPRATEVSRVLAVVHPRIRAQVPSELEKETILDSFLSHHDPSEAELESMLLSISQNHLTSYEKFILLLIETAHYLNHFPKAHSATFFRLYALIIRKQLVPNNVLLGRMLSGVLDCLESFDDIRYTCGMDILREMSYNTTHEHRGLLLSRWIGFTKRLVSLYPVIRKNKPLVDALMRFSPTLFPYEIGSRNPPPTMAELNSIFSDGLDPMMVTGLTQQSLLSSYRSHLRWKRDRVDPVVQQRALLFLCTTFEKLKPENVDMVAHEILSNLDLSYYPLIARFIVDQVINMAFHYDSCPPEAQRARSMELWARLVSSMHRYALDVEIAGLSFSLIHLMLENDRVCPQHVGIIHALSVFGQWIGAVYLQMGFPIKLHHLDLKLVIIEGFDNNNLYGILPMTISMLRQGSLGEVYRYPNPYLCGIAALLKRVMDKISTHPPRRIFTPPAELLSSVTPHQLAMEINQLLSIQLAIPDVVYSQYASNADVNVPPSQRPVRPVSSYVEHVSCGPYTRIAPNKVFDIFHRLHTTAETPIDTHVPVHCVHIPKTDLMYYFPDSKRFILFCLEHAINELFSSVRDKFCSQIESTLNMTSTPQSEKFRYCERLVNHYIGRIPTETLTKQFFLRAQHLVEPLPHSPDTVSTSGSNSMNGSSTPIQTPSPPLSSLPITPITQYAAIPLSVLDRTAELTIQANLIAIRQRCMTFLSNLSILELQQHNQRLQGHGTTQQQPTTAGHIPRPIAPPQQQPPPQQQQQNPPVAVSHPPYQQQRQGSPGAWEQVLANVSINARPSLEKLANIISQVVTLASSAPLHDTTAHRHTPSSTEQLAASIHTYSNLISSIAQSGTIFHDVLVRYIVCFVVEVFFLPEMKMSRFLLEAVHALLASTIQHVPYPYTLSSSNQPPISLHPLTYEFTSRLLFASCEAKETERLHVFRQLVIPFFVETALITPADVDFYLHLVYSSSPPNRPLDSRFEVWMGLVLTFISPVSLNTPHPETPGKGDGSPEPTAPIILITMLPQTLGDIRQIIVSYTPLLRQFTPPQWGEKVRSMLSKLQLAFTEAITTSAQQPVVMTPEAISNTRFNYATSAPNVQISGRLASLTAGVVAPSPGAVAPSPMIRILPMPPIPQQNVTKPHQSSYPPNTDPIDARYPTGFVKPLPPSPEHDLKGDKPDDKANLITAPPNLRSCELLRTNHEAREKRIAQLDSTFGTSMQTLNKNKADHIINQWMSLYTSPKSSNQNYQTFATTVLFSSDILSSMQNLTYFFACLIHSAALAIQQGKVIAEFYKKYYPNGDLPRQFANGVVLTSPQDFRVPTTLANLSHQPSVIAEGITALVVFICSHKQTPLTQISHQQGRGDDLYINSTVVPPSIHCVANEMAPFRPIGAAFATRVKILREYVLSLVEYTRGAHNTALSSHSPSASGTSPLLFNAPLCSLLFTSLLTLLHQPNIPVPSKHPLDSDPEQSVSAVCERVPLFDLSNIDVLLVFYDAFSCLSPSRCPGFALEFLNCISHRSFMYRMMTFGSPYLSNYYRQLLTQSFTAVRAPLWYLANQPQLLIPQGHRRLFRSLVRVVSLIQRDFSFNLSEISLLLCLDSFVVDGASQLRNIILSSTPYLNHQPHPSIVRLDTVQDNFTPPPSFRDSITIMLGLANFMLQPLYDYLKVIQSIIQNSTTAVDQYAIPPIPDNLIRHLLQQPPPYANPNPPITEQRQMLGCILYLTHTGSTQFVTQLKHNPNGHHYLGFIRGNSAAEVLVKFIDAFSYTVRHDMLSIMVNFLQYPSTYTFFMSAFFQYLYYVCSRNVSSHDTCHHMLTILVRRCMASGSKPWGLQHTLLSILSSQDFSSSPFLHANPSILPKLNHLRLQLQR